MKAVVFDRYGPPDVLRLEDIPKPSPKSNEILIKIAATTVSAGDWRMRKPSPMLARLMNGLIKPKRIKVLGLELSGIVEAVGRDVKRFKPGDEVFAFTGFTFGAYAEYICMAENLAPKDGMTELKPGTLSFEQAVAVPAGGLTALAASRTANIRAGQKLLVYGASGNVGSYMVQIAKHLGAEVTGVCGTSNLDMVLSLGADHVIDYKNRDFTQMGEKYDIVFDAVGKLKATHAARALTPGGRFLSVMKSGPLEKGDLLRLKELAESGVLRPFIDRTYAIEDIVEAHRYVEQGHKRANVVVTLLPQNK